jgi:Glycosyl transferases group 1
VSYEDAFEALKDDDLPRAIVLLEKAARETGYSSDIINHAYTLALYRAGDKSRLADVAFQVGNSFVEHDRGSAMDYFQRALIAGLDSDRINQIGSVFETWTAPIDTATCGPLPNVKRVAHVVGSLSPGEPRTEYLKMLVSSLRLQDVESSVFTTEWSASWFFNHAGVAQSQPVEMDAVIRIADVEGDFENRALRVAKAIHDSGIGVAFFHAALDQQITARVASMRPAAVQINIGHDSEMAAPLFDGRIYLSENAMKRTRFSGRAEWIPSATNIESKLKVSEPVTRQSLGLESAGSVSATFGDLHHAAGREYLGVLVEIMNRFPTHFHLFAGGGNVRAMRSVLHSEGVLPRVRFLGQVSDVASLLDVLDVYLASFPICDANSVQDAMGAGKPVVVLRAASESPNNTAAELVRIPELIASGKASYIDIADRLLRNSAFRSRQSQAVKQRFQAEFRPERLGERYKAFLQQFVL